ncbi:MAG: hypothetical protein WA733_09885 [Methylocystis sp.]|jgi:hypothetical protein
MGKGIKERLHHWWAVLSWPTSAVFAFLSGVSLLAFIRDELLPPERAAALKMPSYIPSLPWYYWALGALALLLAGVLEGSYKVTTGYSKQQFVGQNITVPNMPLWQLFPYINPNYLGNDGREVGTISRDIIDKLSLGIITAWGRKADQGTEIALAEIDRSYWQNARFTDWVYMEDAAIDAHAVPHKHLIGTVPTYREILFNREQVEAAWPKSTRPSPATRISAVAAFNRILEHSKWAQNLRENPSLFRFEAWYPNRVSPEQRTRERLLQQLNQDLHDKLRDGAISAWGRPVKHEFRGDAPLRVIAKEEWDDIELILDRRALDGTSSRPCARTRAGIRDSRLMYVDVEFDRSEIERAYGLNLEGAGV